MTDPNSELSMVGLPGMGAKGMPSPFGGSGLYPAIDDGLYKQLNIDPSAYSLSYSMPMDQLFGKDGKPVQGGPTQAPTLIATPATPRPQSWFDSPPNGAEGGGPGM